MSFTLVMGSKRWSSWSLRPWLALKHLGIPFAEIVIPLRRADTKARILEYSPSGKVPVLLDGTTTVWDSLAILDYVDRRFAQGGLWPEEEPALAVARSIAAEMHSGFPAIRRELPMDIGADNPTPALSDVALAEIARVTALWRDARGQFGAGGPFLFGSFTAADAMYAPVVTRFKTYGVAIDGVSHAYCEAVLALPAMRDWYAAVASEARD
jgi:glutathione S-transferase